MKLLKCPKCGEMFSDSYKECPFCAEDEELAQGGKARHGRRIQRQKAPSIGGPALAIVIVFLAAFLVYAFFGDKISALFEKTDKPPVEDVTPTPSPTPDTPVSLTLDQQTLTLVEGGSAKLTVSGAENCIWTSSNTAAATVSDDGIVTAVGAGSATVSVTTADGSATATCNVTVTEKKPLAMVLDRSISGVLYDSVDGVNNYDTNMERIGVTWTLHLEGATGEVQWSIADTSVATITPDGSSCQITSVGNSRTGTILSATVDGQTITCIVRVYTINS